MLISARELWRNPARRTAYLLQVVAIVALAGWWVALNEGLSSRSTRDPQKKLDAGGRFAVTFSVYMPFFLLVTPCLVSIGIAGLTWYRFAPKALAFGAICEAVFTHWVRSDKHLLDYKPALLSHLDTSVLLASLAGVAALAAIVLQARGSRPVPAKPIPHPRPDATNHST
ncbi:hypothetical protein DFR70_11424 [Nocardia tenerifensis]|uniref:Uncharacterized protein n=1 Tax=Nocardia tenerifensis TaxID=228006 RepID=A0A318KF82_9NOCA|nr:hypothetical protein [Nocardia tenerifensis]PXX58342.1 hypothetical protein DFR70_11424 [Nocardia tenerifensis]